MGLNANEQSGGGGSFTPIEADTYPARLVAVVEMGLQAQRPYKGQEKAPVQELGLIYEIPDVYRQDENGDDMTDRPVWIKEVMPFYNLDADRAKSTLRYKAIDPSNKAKGDWTKLLNEPIALTVVINEGKDGRQYENVGAITKPMRGVVVPDLVNTPFFFLLDDPEKDAWDMLPQWMQKKIVENLNFKGSRLEECVENWDNGDETPSTDDGMDDIPF